MLVLISNCKEHDHDEHTEAKIKIIIDKNALSIDLTAHSEPILGFEHEASSKEDKQTQLKRIAEFEQNFTKMVKLSDKCKYTKQSIDIRQDGHHIIFHSLYNIRCTGLLTGKQIQFHLTKFYPEITKLEIEMLKEGGSKTIDVNANGGKVEL